MVDEETYSTKGPICPHCEHMHTPDEPFYYNEDTTELECARCDEAFSVKVYRQISWTCTPKERANG